eukprot:1516083-Rhodomonas_salina.1
MFSFPSLAMAALSLALLASTATFSAAQLSAVAGWSYAGYRYVQLVIPALWSVLFLPASLGEVRAFGAMIMLAALSWRRTINENLLGIDPNLDTQSIIGVLSMLLYSFRFRSAYVLPLSGVPMSSGNTDMVAGAAL